MSTREAERRPAPAPLLHNMSCRPDTPLRMSGKDHCVRVRIDPERWRSSFPRRLPGVRTLARLLGVEGDRSPRQAVCRALDRVAEEAGLPELVPVLGHLQLAQEVAGVSDRLEVVLAVLAKSSDRVFLRRKTPMLTAIRPSRRLTLILPESWEAS